MATTTPEVGADVAEMALVWAIFDEFAMPAFAPATQQVVAELVHWVNRGIVVAFRAFGVDLAAHDGQVVVVDDVFLFLLRLVVSSRDGGDVGSFVVA